MKLRLWALVALALLACSRDRHEGTRKETVLVPSAPTGLPAMLPADGEVPGWVRTGEVEAFGAGSLWEYIDGAAESYLEYGFQEMVTAEYAGGEPGESVVVDIYRTVDGVHTFGIYRNELPAEPQPAAIGVEGDVAGNSLRFWAGAYYVKVTGSGESEALEHGMQELAGAVAGRVGDPGGIPLQVGFFPTEGLIPASIRFVPVNVLSQSSLRRGFEASYRLDGGEGRLVIVELPDGAAAAGAVRELESFVASSGEPVAAVEDLAEGGFAGRHGLYGSVVAVRTGSRLVVAVGFSRPATARQLLDACVQRIGTPGAPAPPGKGE